MKSSVADFFPHCLKLVALVVKNSKIFSFGCAKLTQNFDIFFARFHLAHFCSVKIVY